MPAEAGVRERVLRGFGAGDAEVAELLAYNDNAFRLEGAPGPDAFPLPDEPFVEAWAGYAADAERRGVLPVLREHLVQLRFPVRAGISQTEEYLAATRRGVLPDGDVDGGVALEAPNALRLFLHPTAAGRIPVLVAGSRADFVALLRALARRNEPDPVPASMGATAIGGYVNWGRVAELRRRFEAGELDAGGAADWSAAFRWVRERRELYQDRFVLLAPGGYSGVAAADLGLGEEEWLRTSLTIRLEHECAHYFTRRVLGSMRNALHDELIADYAGIVGATGHFRADWFLRFMGLEAPSAYRPGGRLESYCGTPALSDGAFAVLQALVRSAALNLEQTDRKLRSVPPAELSLPTMLLALASFTLEELAARGAGDWLTGCIERRPA
ncbi:MAG TPA: hypothetical protein VK399_19490 [Longimicrobiaceae bacterium]|nr:hypothetical protein [Longimicrobiaceae bacterium]